MIHACLKMQIYLFLYLHTCIHIHVWIYNENILLLHKKYRCKKGEDFATHCKTLQALQHSATHFNTLQCISKMNFIYHHTQKFIDMDDVRRKNTYAHIYTYQNIYDSLNIFYLSWIRRLYVMWIYCDCFVMMTRRCSVCCSVLQCVL